MLDNAYTNPLGWESDEGDKHDDPNYREFERLAREGFELCIAIKKTFGSKDGKKVLAWLKDATHGSATWMSGMPYNEAIAHGFAREGQNALVRDLENKIKMAEDCKSVDDYMDKLTIMKGQTP